MYHAVRTHRSACAVVCAVDLARKNILLLMKYGTYYFVLLKFQLDARLQVDYIYHPLRYHFIRKYVVIRLYDYRSISNSINWISSLLLPHIRPNYCIESTFIAFIFIHLKSLSTGSEAE